MVTLGESGQQSLFYLHWNNIGSTLVSAPILPKLAVLVTKSFETHHIVLCIIFHYRLYAHMHTNLRVFSALTMASTIERQKALLDQALMRAANQSIKNIEGIQEQAETIAANLAEAKLVLQDQIEVLTRLASRLQRHEDDLQTLQDLTGDLKQGVITVKKLQKDRIRNSED